MGVTGRMAEPTTYKYTRESISKSRRRRVHGRGTRKEKIRLRGERGAPEGEVLKGGIPEAEVRSGGPVGRQAHHE